MSNSLNIPSDKPDEGLPRTLILSHRGWVKQLFNSGRRYHHRLVTLIELSKPVTYLETGKVAFFTPKKIGKAHDRTRIRRQMKEIYRRSLQEVQSEQLWIWLAKPTHAQSSFEDFDSAMKALVQKSALKSSS